MDRRKKQTRWLIGLGVAAVILYFALKNFDILGDMVLHIFGIFLPLILGLAFAMILNVPMSLLEKRLFRKAKRPFWRRLRRPLAIFLSVLLIFSILAGIIWLIIPELVSAIRIVAEHLIEWIDRLTQLSHEDMMQLPFGRILVNINWDNTLSSIRNWLKSQSGNIVSTAVGTIGSVIGGVVNFVFGLVFAVYILANKEKLKLQVIRLMQAWLPERFCMKLTRTSSIVRINFRNFVAGQSLEALILGSLCIVGMAILRIPYPLMVGTLVGIGALVPVIGAVAAAGIGAFIIFTESPVQALVFLVFLIILQQIDGNLIYPRIMGERVNLPAMWILAAVTVGGGIAGPIGMLLGVPIASTVYALVKDATEQREKKKKD